MRDAKLVYRCHSFTVGRTRLRVVGLRSNLPAVDMTRLAAAPRRAVAVADLWINHHVIKVAPSATVGQLAHCHVT
ncbi:hypothetical protein J6590_002023 [Homalodisca vitripennis]|nr:hypothetical protein J6590_002023 [Homalodisca vitripennis]